MHEASEAESEAGNDLAGRAFIVTGATKGIGAAIGRAAALHGAVVLGVARSATPVAPNPRIEMLRCDVTEPGAPERILTAALDRFGRVDGLVNNAGIIRYGDCWNYSDDDWDLVFDVNLTSPFLLSQAVVRHWLAQAQGGVIVNITSVEAEIAFPRQVGYIASKGALAGLTRAMAADLGPHGIRVVSIAPGEVVTEMSTSVDRNALIRTIPLNRLGTPNDVAEAAVFLLSDRASYITGTTLVIDGGYVTI